MNISSRRRSLGIALLLGMGLAACGGGGGGNSDSSSAPASGGAASAPAVPPPVMVAKSAKRGVAYDFASEADLAAVAPGVSWWYDWALTPNTALPAGAASRQGVDFVPMLWNGNFVDADVEAQLKANTSIHYLLVLNEPNLTDQANLTPAQAAQLWPRYEAIAAHTGVKLVGPAMTWGTQAGYSDPVVWLDAFYAAYRSANGGRDPQIDVLAFHWYDYGLADQLDRLSKYGKPFWVTEMANWHSQTDGAQIDTADKQKAQLADMVAVCEGRADVQRYAWFTGRMGSGGSSGGDPHFTSLLSGTTGSGQLTALGTAFLAATFPH
ncbi:MAG TPA: glycosyl hydrolase [Burkholderiaceae bacterium]